ncbi:MAG: acylphosphatase [Candidatus Bathyarchaeota archaeon]|nr:MAG: acylphosphatase [Candidatus Bathyarchaeota archaeon]
MKMRAHMVIQGRVQGVFFRWETRRRAQNEGVTGWIRNLPDGNVEAVFEGEQVQVDRVVDFCRKGPLGARVQSVQVTYEKFLGEFSDFRIKL